MFHANSSHNNFRNAALLSCTVAQHAVCQKQAQSQAQQQAAAGVLSNPLTPAQPAVGAAAGSNGNASVPPSLPVAPKASAMAQAPQEVEALSRSFPKRLNIYILGLEAKPASELDAKAGGMYAVASLREHLAYAKNLFNAIKEEDKDIQEYLLKPDFVKNKKFHDSELLAFIEEYKGILLAQSKKQAMVALLN